MHLFHKWNAVATNQRDQPVSTNLTRVTGEFAKGVSIPKTDVLYRCRCGAVKSVDIDGRWTLEQLRDSSPDKEKG